MAAGLSGATEARGSLLSAAALEFHFAQEIVHTRRSQDRIQPVAREWKSGDFGSKLLRRENRSVALAAARERECLLQSNLDPDLPDIGAAFLAREEPHPEQRVRAGVIAR